MHFFFFFLLLLELSSLLTSFCGATEGGIGARRRKEGKERGGEREGGSERERERERERGGGGGGGSEGERKSEMMLATYTYLYSIRYTVCIHNYTSSHTVKIYIMCTMKIYTC